jgi:UDP-4-amino-4,6-dideoxy-N-acetyl-beta-L-altrosamine N-acetyltransferase
VSVKRSEQSLQLSNAGRLRLRPMTLDDLERVLAWRNHPNVRRYMFSQQEITLIEHRRWYAKCLETGSNRLLIFEREGKPQGFVNFKVPDGSRASEWGFYLAPGAPKGSGRQMGVTALRFGFDELNAKKIIGRTLITNVRSIRFHRRLGFHEENVPPEKHFAGERYHDVVCFGLLHSEWVSLNSDSKNYAGPF